MKTRIIINICCIAGAFAFAGCVHSPNTTAHKVSQQPVGINIARDGALSVAGKQCRQSELAAILTQLSVKPTTTVVIRADVDVPFKLLVTVVDTCKNAGVEQVSCVTAK